MSESSRAVGFIWRIMRWLNPYLEGRFRSGGKPGQFVLLLTTKGRKTGRDHITPLQYELVDNAYFVASARGPDADWYQNILVNPGVEVEIEGNSFLAQAEGITDAQEIADFVELRLRKRPRMIGTMLRLEGLPANFTREELETFAGKKALVVIRPTEEVEQA